MRLELDWYMNRQAIHSKSDSASRPRSRPKAKTTDEFVSLVDTRALLAGSAADRKLRLEAGDMVTTDEAAALAGASRVTVNAWIAKGRAIGLTQTKRGFRLPRWQFDQPLWELIPALASALGTSEGWALLAFLETPHGALDGKTPRQVIEQGQGDKVVELAKRDT